MSCDAKKMAALGALEIIRGLDLRDGELVGIGTGSTVRAFLDVAYEFLKGKRLMSSSNSTALELSSRGFDVIYYPSTSYVRLYVDGADEVVPATGDMIKGGGGALLGEKILAFASALNIFIVSEDKVVERLGSRSPVPIEVLPEALPFVMESLKAMGLKASPRASAGKMGPVVSDWRGVIVDVFTGPISDPRRLNESLESIPGVIETGLFVGFADYVVVGRRSCTYDVFRLRRVVKAPYL